MELEIFWSQFAEDKLYDVFQYYKFKAGIEVSKKIINEIVDKTLILENNSKAGQIEELLLKRQQEFRCLVSEIIKSFTTSIMTQIKLSLRMYLMQDKIH